MKPPVSDGIYPNGVSLVETVIAIGVLAVAIPLVFGALAEGGMSVAASEAETRSTWIIPACMEEIRASREGKPQYFTSTTQAQTFPPGGDVWALAFSRDGKPVGKLSKTHYDTGAKDLNGKPIRYIATLSSTTDIVKIGTSPMLKVRITIEYPSAARAAKREKFDFYTRIP